MTPKWADHTIPETSAFITRCCCPRPLPEDGSEVTRDLIANNRSSSGTTVPALCITIVRFADANVQGHGRGHIIPEPLSLSHCSLFL